MDKELENLTKEELIELVQKNSRDDEQHIIDVLVNSPAFEKAVCEIMKRYQILRIKDGFKIEGLE